MQSAFLDWLFYNHRNIFDVTFAPSNEGRRTAKEAYFAKRRGLKPGVPDLFIPVARSGFHGLFIELKILPNKATPSQLRMMALLTLQNYRCIICYTLEAMIQVFQEYLDDKQFSVT